MIARSIVVLGAALAVMTTADANAFGRKHGCCQPKVCYKKVVTPPVYKTVMERVLVQPARCTNVHTPPVYGTKPQTVVVEPERQVARVIPAVYGKVKTTELVRPGYTKWKHKRGRCGVHYKCAVEVPPKYRKVKRCAVVQPARYWVETKPAVMGIVHRRVMIHPGSVRKVCHPAVYKTVARQVMVSPGSEHWVSATRGRRCH